MTAIRFINLSLQIWGCILTGIIITCLYLGQKVELKSGKYYAALLIFNAGVMFFDALAFYFRGGADVLDFYGVRLTNLLSFCCSAIVPTVFVHYLIHSFKHPEDITRIPLRISHIICVLYIGLYITNVFHPFFYDIDMQNVYHRLAFYPLTFLPGFWNIGISLYMLHRYQDQMEKTERTINVVYLLAPIPAFLVQMFMYGLNLTNFMGLVIMVLIFLFLQFEQASKLVQQENELLSARVDITLSQIQPHFLYNALTAIYCLCDTDPAIAKDAISDFSKYLRGNLDSIKQVTPIAFTEELNHLKAYLSLEKLRYDDYLDIIYDISATDFLIPPLTVQPLVENAVNHGISNLSNGGCVTISSRETSDSFEVRVTDNGAGFVPGVLPQDGRSHVGISSVRSRLSIMCGGTLEIISAPGKGTTAIIRLPKQ